MRDEMQIIDAIVLVDGCCGIYVPVGFYNRYNGSEYLHNANADDMEYIGNADNMENDDYWDTWASIMDNAFFLVEGKKYHIEYGEFSGDLMAICYEQQTLNNAHLYFNCLHFDLTNQRSLIPNQTPIKQAG